MRQPALRDVDRIGVAHVAFRCGHSASHDPRKLCDGNRLSGEPYVVSRESVNAACAGLCMTLRASGRGIDSGAPHVNCAHCSRDRGTSRAHRERAVPIASLIANPMTKPDRLAAASAALAQASAFPTAGTTPAARADHDLMANAIRALAMDAVEQAKSGHPGLPMGAADIATVLFTRFLKFDPADPAWPDRDRFVLSAGHGSMLLYALFYLLGYPKMTIEEIKRFRQLGSLTPGHPEHGHTPGVETTTGPLGQGLANAVGMAIAERHLAALFGGDDRRSHDLRARLRWRSDGRHQPGSDRARRPSATEKTDRALRRQRHFDRRADVAVGFGRSGGAFQIRRLGGDAHRRPRSGGDCRSARSGTEIRPAVHDRLPHHHRLRRAEQGRHREEPRLAARRR